MSCAAQQSTTHVCKFIALAKGWTLKRGASNQPTNTSHRQIVSALVRLVDRAAVRSPSVPIRLAAARYRPETGAPRQSGVCVFAPSRILISRMPKIPREIRMQDQSSGHALPLLPPFPFSGTQLPDIRAFRLLLFPGAKRYEARYARCYVRSVRQGPCIAHHVPGSDAGNETRDGRWGSIFEMRGGGGAAAIELWPVFFYEQTGHAAATRLGIPSCTAGSQGSPFVPSRCSERCFPHRAVFWYEAPMACSKWLWPQFEPQ
ncbi:hypothetical protein B0J13DRAFT_521699 [Dactylonectria estremocensis]|uniref:Uncharacterized protein n=1 Tax=Dactylonectria estremocensis TaxID=1079267 RepID=A0A9P9F6A0_9HYPO|nr:hypothetical protein B0J13DRAFT_521699 [Dactylonectria estremocensis]